MERSPVQGDLGDQRLKGGRNARSDGSWRVRERTPRNCRREVAFVTPVLPRRGLMFFGWPNRLIC